MHVRAPTLYSTVHIREEEEFKISKNPPAYRYQRVELYSRAYPPLAQDLSARIAALDAELAAKEEEKQQLRAALAAEQDQPPLTHVISTQYCLAAESTEE